MSSTQIGGFHCPFRGFHCCSDGREGSKGFSCMVSHLKIQHLCSEERKSTLREAIKSDLGLFVSLEESLRGLQKWLCGRCMTIRALSRPCHHSNGLVRVTLEGGEVGSYIIGIPKPSTKDFDTLGSNEGLILDARLLERILQASICTVKNIPHSCRLAFSQTLKEAIYKVVVEPSSIGAWVQLLLLPRCTLQVVKPQNRQDRSSGNRNSLQQHYIMECLATWRESDGLAS
jgi:hypothetical protein